MRFAAILNPLRRCSERNEREIATCQRSVGIIGTWPNRNLDGVGDRPPIEPDKVALLQSESLRTEIEINAMEWARAVTQAPRVHACEAWPRAPHPTGSGYPLPAKLSLCPTSVTPQRPLVGQDTSRISEV